MMRTTDDVSAVEQALVENLHRDDLTPLEEAAAYQQLIEDFGLTHEEVAQRVGKSRSAITNTLRLLGLPRPSSTCWPTASSRAGHARALLGHPTGRCRSSWPARRSADGWSVRTVEEAVARRCAGATRATATNPRDPTDDGAGLGRRPALRPPGLLELEQLLADHLDTRVGVQMGGQAGQGDDRLRRPRRPGADLPPDHGDEDGPTS